jgi:hypothetical protein
MDNIDNKIMPIEAINLQTSSTGTRSRTINVTSRRKRCKRGTRRNKRTHRCRKNKK